MSRPRWAPGYQSAGARERHRKAEERRHREIAYESRRRWRERTAYLEHREDDKALHMAAKERRHRRWLRDLIRRKREERAARRERRRAEGWVLLGRRWVPHQFLALLTDFEQQDGPERR